MKRLLKYSFPSPAAAVVFCVCAWVIVLGSTPALAQRMMPFSFWQEVGFAPRGTEPVRVDVPRDTVIAANDDGNSSDRKGRIGLDLLANSPLSPSLVAWQPFPNPFGAASYSGASATSIRIELSEEAPVTVRLFTLLSQPLITLFDAVLPQGKHTLRIIPPHALSGGTYFVGISSGKSTLLIRIVYLR